MAVIAVIFDFDDTLVPDSTSQLLKSEGIDPVAFWTTEAKALVDQGYDPPTAYLNLLLDRVGPGKPLGTLTNQALRDFGATLDSTWFPGLPALFSELEELVKPHRDVTVEFYIISGGLEEIITGSSIVRKHFKGWYGCQFGEDPETGLVRYIKRCVTFTEKTRYIFEINKGITAEESRTKPHLVNEVYPDPRRVPLDHMIYVGDGLTDIPCFSLLKHDGGHPIGVFGAGAESAKQAFKKFLRTSRVIGAYSPDYTRDLGTVIRAAVTVMASNIALRLCTVPQ